MICATLDAEGNADGLIAAFAHQLVSVVVYMHLTNVLMGEMTYLEIDQNKVVRYAVIEHYAAVS